VVLIVMMTGRLVHYKGSLARAALPLVIHLRWGWHRVERAMERGAVVLDVLFDHAFAWCVANLPVQPDGPADVPRPGGASTPSGLQRSDSSTKHAAYRLYGHPFQDDRAGIPNMMILAFR
jgi:hypothetical protein